MPSPDGPCTCTGQRGGKSAHAVALYGTRPMGYWQTGRQSGGRSGSRRTPGAQKHVVVSTANSNGTVLGAVGGIGCTAIIGAEYAIVSSIMLASTPVVVNPHHVHRGPCCRHQVLRGWGSSGEPCRHLLSRCRSLLHSLRVQHGQYCLGYLEAASEVAASSVPASSNANTIHCGRCQAAIDECRRCQRWQ